MKRAITAAIMVCWLTACSKHNQPSLSAEPVATPAQDQATNAAIEVVQSPPPVRKISGAFGWKLGQVVPKNLRAPLNDGFNSGSYFTNSTNFPPFISMGLSLLNDGRVFLIRASKGNATEDEKDLVVEALYSKYGSTNFTVTNEDGKGFIGRRSTSWSWDDGFAVIYLNYCGVEDVNMLQIDYTDHELQSEFEAEQKARNDARISPISTNL